MHFEGAIRMFRIDLRVLESFFKVFFEIVRPLLGKLARTSADREEKIDRQEIKIHFLH